MSQIYQDAELLQAAHEVSTPCSERITTSRLAMAAASCGVVACIVKRHRPHAPLKHLIGSRRSIAASHVC
jgi:hypothetical protein